MKLDLDMPLQCWHILDDLLGPMETYIGVWADECDPLDVIQEVRRAINKMESKA